MNPSVLGLVHGRYPATKTSTNLGEVLADEAVDAVVLATPTATHAELAVACLEADKDVLIEKPLAASLTECRDIESVVGDRVLMVGHTFLYNPAIQRLRELVAGGQLGEVHYLDSIRAGLGPIREDVDVLWDLGPHDVSIFLSLIPAPPVSVSCLGRSFLREGFEDVVYLHIHFEAGVLASSHLSWLDPYKVRQMTVVGSQRMAVFDDVAVDERLKILDRGASYAAVSEEARGQNYGGYRAVLRQGDIVIPRVSSAEPLALEFDEFVARVRDRGLRHSGLTEGIEVVAVLEAAERSLSAGGSPVPVELEPLGR